MYVHILKEDYMKDFSEFGSISEYRDMWCRHKSNDFLRKCKDVVKYDRYICEVADALAWSLYQNDDAAKSTVYL